MDVCDYDVHNGCYGGMNGYEELDLACKKRHKLVKRKQGFEKMVTINNIAESSVNLAVWFCDACDSNAIFFAEQ